MSIEFGFSLQNIQTVLESFGLGDIKVIPLPPENNHLLYRSLQT